MSEQTKAETSSGFMTWIQRQTMIVRVLVFALLVVGIVATLFFLTAFLYFQNIRAILRTIPAAIPDTGVSVSEFVQFNAADGYPATVAVAQDGTLYSASYVTGAVWRIAADGTIQTIPNTEEQIGSVNGLTVDSTGTVYVLDRLDPLLLNGAVIWRIQGNTLEQVISIPPQGRRFVGFANDIAVDAAGNLYVADVLYAPGIGRVLRISQATGEIDEWWQMPDASTTNPSAPAGLAYDGSTNTLLVTDAARDAIYRISLTEADPAAETLYQFSGAEDEQPGLNGITVTNEGVIYVAAVGLNRVARLDAGNLVYLAAGFRGGSDVAYDAVGHRLFVNNWDQRWLLPVDFLFLSQQFEARLPFSIDVIDLNIAQ
jgi:sugar lactone lactonase YvrE